MHSINKFSIFREISEKNERKGSDENKTEIKTRERKINSRAHSTENREDRTRLMPLMLRAVRNYFGFK